MKICVKWGREKLDVDADMGDSPMIFKLQLFSLTGVPPDRQKVMIKGRILGDETWSGIQLVEGAQIMMMGSADSLPEAPKDRPQFREDMTDEQVSSATNLPVGMKNLGNTCYMNATLQCYKTIPEVREALLKFQPKANSSSVAQSETGAKMIAGAVRDLYRMMESDSSKRAGSVIPLYMLQALHTVIPQFSARDDHGQWMQQDANECWTEIHHALKSQLLASQENEASAASSVISQFMEGRFRVTMKNLESDDEPVSTSTEKFVQLSCFLSQDVKYLQLGIKGKLTEEIEKHSMILDRNARYEKKALVERLPAYLSIQMVRFFYKEKEKVNAKILKDVKFPLDLDMFEMCTPELQKKLIPMRDAFKDAEEKKLQALQLSKIEGPSKEPKKEEKVVNYAPFAFEDDPGSNNSGFYELQAVLTHKGRSSNSGHYVAWVRIDGDRWAMCDDDEVHPVSGEEDIKKLSGGGDWHCAYLLLYGPRRLKL